MHIKILTHIPLFGHSIPTMEELCDSQQQGCPAVLLTLLHPGLLLVLLAELGWGLSSRSHSPPSGCRWWHLKKGERETEVKIVKDDCQYWRSDWITVTKIIKNMVIIITVMMVMTPKITIIMITAIAHQILKETPYHQQQSTELGTAGLAALQALAKLEDWLLLLLLHSLVELPLHLHLY